jgi:hypothetical protein
MLIAIDGSGLHGLRKMGELQKSFPKKSLRG